MMLLCPYCGNRLQRPLQSGITSCCHCNRIFDTSDYHRVLSGGWLVRKWNLCCPEQLLEHGYTQDEAELIVGLIFDQQYSHQEFLKIVDELGISKIAA